MRNGEIKSVRAIKRAWLRWDRVEQPSERLQGAREALAWVLGFGEEPAQTSSGGVVTDWHPRFRYGQQPRENT